MIKTMYSAAIIGVGRIGFSLGFDKKREQPASHSFAIKRNKQISLVAACDKNLENLTNWNKVFPKAKVFSKIEDLLDFGKTFQNKTFDIVVIAVNEDSHFECVKKVILAHPRLIILEKPVALNSDEAYQIKQLSQEESVPILVNHERRFSLDYQIAKSWISKIGVIQKIDANLFSGLRIYRKEDEKTGAYSLIHDGTHLVDIVLFLLGLDGSQLSNPILSSSYFDNDGIARNVRVTYKTNDYPDITFAISGRSKFFAFEIDLVGTEGRICIGNGYAKVYLRKESKLYSGFYSLTRVKKIKFPKKTKYFSNMIQNAVDYLDGKEKLKSTFDDGYQVLIILEQIKKLIA